MAGPCPLCLGLPGPIYGPPCSGCGGTGFAQATNPATGLFQPLATVCARCGAAGEHICTPALVDALVEDRRFHLVVHSAIAALLHKKEVAPLMEKYGVNWEKVRALLRKNLAKDEQDAMEKVASGEADALLATPAAPKKPN